jgi:hypothetical protein
MARWKKPKWVSNVQKAASNAVRIENKPAILQNVQKAAQKAANWTGEAIKSVAEPYQDRTPRVKAMPENDTGLANTKTAPQAFDPVDAQVARGKAMTSVNRENNTAFIQKGMAQDRQDVQAGLESSGYTPVVQRISDSLRTASGGSGTTPLPPLAPGDGEGTVTPGAGRPVQRADTNYQRFASGGAAVQAIPVPAPDVADVVPTGTGPSDWAPIGAPVSRLTGEQPAPQRGGSRLSRMLKRIPRRSMSM